MKTLGTDYTNKVCTILIQCYKIVHSSNSMTQTKKSRIRRKKGEEEDSRLDYMNSQKERKIEVSENSVDSAECLNQSIRISQLLQNNYVDFNFEDKAIKGGIYL